MKRIDLSGLRTAGAGGDPARYRAGASVQKGSRHSLG